MMSENVLVLKIWQLPYDIRAYLMSVAAASALGSVHQRTLDITSWPQHHKEKNPHAFFHNVTEQATRVRHRVRHIP
jgi:hypothetical protein